MSRPGRVGPLGLSPEQADLFIRELARHFTDCEPPRTLQDALACLAEACWMHADQTPDVYANEEAARALVLRALTFAGRARSEYRAARRVVEAFLKRKNSRLLPRTTEDVTSRLQRTYWLMAMRLSETAVGGQCVMIASGHSSSVQLC